MELKAVILLLSSSRALFGAFLGCGLMVGAILTHLLILGIEVQGDGGTLFILATVTFIACGVSVFLRRHQLFAFIKIIVS